MPVLDFYITKSAEDWERLESIIKAGRKVSINAFIATEVSTLIKATRHDPCASTKSVMVKKHFVVKMESDEDVQKINCLACNMGVAIGAFISKKIIDKKLCEASATEA